LIDPAARWNLLAFNALPKRMAEAIHNVFWVGTALAAMALLVFLLPFRATTKSKIEPPTREPAAAEPADR